jgi:secondary thiamine-phosphate synthase enzyme
MLWRAGLRRTEEFKKERAVSMRQFVEVLSFCPPRRGLLEITPDIVRWVEARAIGAGLLTLFCRHTSASLIIQENAAPEVRADLEDFIAGLAPESPGRYRHDDEGPDDMPAHIRTALTGVNLSIPVIGGRPALGTWQGVYLFEHRRRPTTREIACHLLGE